MNNFSFKNLYRQAPASASICVLLFIVYVITAVQSHSLVHNLDYSSLGDEWSLYPPAMRDNHLTGPLRAFGGMLLHSGPTHLFFNSMVIYFFGREMERVLSSREVIEVFLASGIGGAIAVMICNPYTITVGASGAGYGFMAMFVAISARYRMDLRAPIVLILANIFFSVTTPGISFWGHVGGLVVGALLGVLFYFVHNPQTRQRAFLAILLLSYAIVMALAMI